MMVRRAWPMLRGLLRHLRPWLDTRTYRPLILLVVLALAGLLLPLALDVASAVASGIPPRVTRTLGQAAMVGGLALGLRRIALVRPGDEWPGVPRGVDSRAARWLPWALRLAVATLVFPATRNPENLGFADWDFVLDKFEAVRRTILVWGQFPWWHPWCRGGFPLAAEPQIGAISMATPLILTLGTAVGLRVASVLCMMIAVEGAYRLAWLWLREPWAAATTALVYGLNGAVSVDTVNGYIIAMSYASLPWLAYHAFRIGEGCRQGVGLGFWAAFTVLNGIQYITLYAVALSAVIWMRALQVQPSGTRGALVRGTLAAVGTFLLLSGWRLATMVPILLEDRRERVTVWDESILSAIGYLLDRPRPDWPEFLPGRAWGYYCALISYIGIPVFAMALWSLRRGWRWWHTLIILTGWLAIGSQRWYQPSAWLADWPFIGSAHVVTRWRFVTMLGLGLAAGSVVARWRTSGRRPLAALGVAATLLIAADYFEIAHRQLPLAFPYTPDPGMFPGPTVPDIVNIREGLGYPCVLRGYGVIEGYEPMLSYYRNAPTLRRARGLPDYRGEAWTGEGEVRPEYWSPNRLVFRVRPGQEVFINQNPGSWWLVNGRRAFAGKGCAEMMLPFAARADDRGRLELRIEPPGLRMGIGLHVLGVAILAVAVVPSWRRAVRARDGVVAQAGSH